jgi:CheY-like chemotaxis protein
MTDHELPAESRPVTTVLIVDDFADFRRQARALLEDEGLLVVGEAADGQTALEETAQLRPDVLLLDIGLPDIDGFEVALRLGGSGDAPKIVLISSRDGALFGERIASSGAAGFIRKDDLSADALEALLPIARTPPGGGRGR